MCAKMNLVRHFLKAQTLETKLLSCNQNIFTKIVKSNTFTQNEKQGVFFTLATVPERVNRPW